MSTKHLFALLLIVASAGALAAGGHDHAEEAGHGESHEEHAGHDEHSGHDHAEEDAHGESHEAHAGHDEHGGHGHEHEEEGVVELSPEQMRTAGVKVETVQKAPVASVLIAPGEVMLNAYRTSRVAPRIEAQIVRRHARLGDHVRKSDPLVTLSSVALAEAQGELLVADREWRRVKKLGRKVVSERRYIEAQVARQQAYAKAQAYGMSDQQITRLLRGDKSTPANGELELLSPQDGTVIEDDFIVGELAEPGRVLFTITDENHLWVDARLNARDANRVRIGAPARIQAGDEWLQGKVIQTRHALDETTRTLSLRIEIDNPDDKLHPGEFVTVQIETSDSEQAIAVPVSAVMRSPDGDWQLFVEEAPGRFEGREVEVVRNAGERLVIEGIEPGTRIVTHGAFFIQSEIAKGGFEIHNH